MSFYWFLFFKDCTRLSFGCNWSLIWRFTLCCHNQWIQLVPRIQLSGIFVSSVFIGQFLFHLTESEPQEFAVCDCIPSSDKLVIMADFPSKVSTETSSHQSPGSQQGVNSLSGLTGNITVAMDMTFIRSIPAILMMAEIVCSTSKSCCHFTLNLTQQILS